MLRNLESFGNVALQKETFPLLRCAGQQRHKGHKRHAMAVTVYTDSSRGQAFLMARVLCRER